jgi:hypothetical protein
MFQRRQCFGFQIKLGPQVVLIGNHRR